MIDDADFPDMGNTIEFLAMGLAYRLVAAPTRDERFRILTTTIQTVDDSQRNELMLNLTSTLATIAQAVIETHHGSAWLTDRIAAHASIAELTVEGIPPDTP